MPPTISGPFNVGSKTFDPETLINDEVKLQTAKAYLDQNDIASAIITYFSLPENDDYVYHAVASVTLQRVHQAVTQGDHFGLNDWYKDVDGKLLGHPPTADITAYTSIFNPHRSAPNTLTAFASNAKKSSLRATIATHLVAHRHCSPDIASVKPLKQPRTHPNPALTFWSWSNHALRWAGPSPSTAALKTSHHLLPVFMHHFGCVVPSYEALALIRQVAAGKAILDVGSGNGYWTFLLRHLGPDMTVVAIDSAQSKYRTLWIADTVRADGIKYLKESRKGGKGDVLLLVYPIVSGDGFTEKVIRAYEGEVLCVVGTQCGNGYTAFQNVVVDEWMDKEGGWEKVVQVPVPSFAGKDEALFVFRRKTKVQ